MFHNGEQLALRLIVVSDGPSLLGRQWLNEMEMDWKTLCQQSHMAIHRVPCGGPESSIENLLEQYSDLFQNELGKLTRFKATLKVLPVAQPMFHRSRSVPPFHALRSAYTGRLPADLSHATRMKWVKVP